MSRHEATLSNAASLEAFGHVMRGKGRHGRAAWALAVAQEIRERAEMSKAPGKTTKGG